MKLSTAAEIIAHFTAQAAEYDAQVASVPATGRRYVVQTSPGLYLRPAVEGVHRVGSIAQAERFESPRAQTLARELRESGQEGCDPQVRECRGALRIEAAELRRLAAKIAEAAA